MMASGLVGLKFEDSRGWGDDDLEVLDALGSWGRASREMVSVEDMIAFLGKLTRKLQ
jgi:hypothetical protein